MPLITLLLSKYYIISELNLHNCLPFQKNKTKQTNKAPPLSAAEHHSGVPQEQPGTTAPRCTYTAPLTQTTQPRYRPGVPPGPSPAPRRGAFYRTFGSPRCSLPGAAGLHGRCRSVAAEPHTPPVPPRAARASTARDAPAHGMHAATPPRVTARCPRDPHCNEQGQPQLHQVLRARPA